MRNSISISNNSERNDRIKQKFGRIFAQIATSCKHSTKFTIHPFRSLHSKHILPLSIPDYIARFSLEFVIITAGIFAIGANVTLASHSQANATRDESIVFSLLQSNPKLNSPL